MPFLLIDKPAGLTSHDVVYKVRKITGEKTVGHAGTLDPFATGLLIVAIGRNSTKQISKYVGLDKVYEAEIVLGATTETLDTESPEIKMNTKNDQLIILSKKSIILALQSLVGDIKQIPPMYSAIKIKGQKLYDLARQGKTIEREPRKVTIFDFSLTNDVPDTISLPTIIKTSIHCSSGTYIRALARDLGEKLETGGYLKQLRRTKIGQFKVTEAQTLENLNQNNWFDLAKNDMLL